MSRSTIFPILLILPAIALGQDAVPYDLSSVPKAAPIKPTGKYNTTFSPVAAARYLDIASLNWQRDRKCATCHTNMAYLMARPALVGRSPSSGEVREFFEQYIDSRWSGEGNAPKDGDYRPVVIATGLVMNDIASNAKLSDASHAALDLMWTTQRNDGSWKWAKCGWAPMEIDDHYGVTLAAIAVGTASDAYTLSPQAIEGIRRLRLYLQKTAAPSIHHRLMMLWTSLHLTGVLSVDQQDKIIEELFASQRSDGGWSTAQFLLDWNEFKRKDNLEPEVLKSDAYATGLGLILLRGLGYQQNDPRIQSAIRWLETHQDDDGKWFTPSPSKDSKQYFTNMGTAFAILGLDAYERLNSSSQTE